MLCRTCRRMLVQRISAPARGVPSIVFRSIATVPSTPNAAPSTPPPPPSSSSTQKDTSPPAISSSSPSKSQPFSEPMLPSSDNAAPQPGPKASSPRQLQSSVSGGTELKGLSYTRGAPPLLAKEDHEYPSWLWTLLDTPADSTSNADEKATVANMSKKTRAKYERKQAKILAGLEKPVPIHEQSRDLTGPGDDAFVSQERRAELTKSSRAARRKEIREDNFLRSM